MDQLPDKPLPIETRNNQSGVEKGDSFIDELLSAKAVYVLYLAGLFTGGVTALIGVVIAYSQRNKIQQRNFQQGHVLQDNFHQDKVQQNNSDQSTGWELSHYEYQIRTFWIGLLYMVVGTLLIKVLIGFFVWIFWILWLVIRCVAGLQFSAEQRPVPNPTGWWFS